MGVRRPTAENLRTRPRDSSKHAGPKLQTADILLFCISYAALGREKGQAPAAHAKFKRKIKPPYSSASGGRSSSSSLRSLSLPSFLASLPSLSARRRLDDPEGGFGGRRPRSASQPDPIPLAKDRGVHGCHGQPCARRDQKSGVCEAFACLQRFQKRA